MPKAYISVGSNIDPFENVRSALVELSRHVKITALSTFRMTDPEGVTDQPRFINGVVEIETDVKPIALKFTVLRKIEEKLGRVHTGDKFAPRTIDLDVIVYDDAVIQSDEITIPDPDIPERAFLAVPLYELAPDMILPGTEIRIDEIAAEFARHTMDPMDDYTQDLRDELGIQ